MDRVRHGRLRVTALVLVCGCGRLGFDPTDVVTDARADVFGATADGPMLADARVGTGENGTCATAVDMPIGSVYANEQVDASDDVAPWGLCPNGPDVVYRITLPEPATISITATTSFNGQITTGTSCPPSLAGQSSCYMFPANQLYERSYSLPAGTTYIIVDKLSGSGSSFEIAVQ